MLTAYRGLEKLVGQKGLVPPKDSTDTDGWNRTWDALGRPKDPKEYQLPVPDGMDRGFADKFAAKFHQFGLNTDQARGIAGAWNEMVTEMANGDSAAFKTKSKAEVDGIWKEMGKEKGSAYFGQVNLAARSLGLQQADVQKLEKALGTRRMFDLLHRAGDGLSEDDLGGDGQGGAGLTPEAAQAKLKDLQGDAAWRKKLLAGDVAARGENDRLNRIIAGG